MLRENLLIPQGWPDASAYISIISYISSFLNDLILFVQYAPSLLELKLLMPMTIPILPAVNIKDNIQHFGGFPLLKAKLDFFFTA